MLTQEQFRQAILQKTAAAPLADFATSVGSSLAQDLIFPPAALVTAPAGLIANFAGQYMPVEGDADTAAEAARKRSFLKAGIPVAGPYMIGRHMANLAKKEEELGVKSPRKKMLAEQMSLLTNPLVGAAIGGLLGAGSSAISGGDSDDIIGAAGTGAAMGGVAGLSLPVIGAAITALIKTRRTVQDQVKADKDPKKLLKTLLIPGYGAYSSFKRIGAADSYSSTFKDK